MPSFKLKGKAQEVKSGFEPYDGPEPARAGMYRGVIKVMKWGANTSGSSGFNITLELEAAPGDPKDHAIYDGYPMFSRSIITESPDGAALKEGAQRNLDNLLAALDAGDDPQVVLEDSDDDKVNVKKIGKVNPVGRVVNIEVAIKPYEGVRRPEVAGIYKYKAIDAPAKSATVVTEDDEDEADLMEESDEVEVDDEIAERTTELEAMGVAALRKLAKELGVTSSGAKAAVIEHILDAEFGEEEEAEDDEAEDADEAEEVDEDEAEDEEEDDEDEEAEEEDDEEREARVAELAELDRVALKKVLKEIAPDTTVLKRHTDDDLRQQIIAVEFADDLPF